MTPADTGTPPDAEDLSALCDGEVQRECADHLVRRWSSDAALRERWHDYALVGDVLRSADLATRCASDTDFVQRLRQRMAAEGLVGTATTGATTSATIHTAHPTTLSAPAPDADRLDTAELPATAQATRPIDLATARARRNGRWRRWSAPVGIAAGVVLVAGVVLLGRQPGAADTTVAAGSPDTPVRVIDRNQRHDPRFDPYLAAHKQYQPAVVLAPSSGLLRNATYDVSSER